MPKLRCEALGFHLLGIGSVILYTLAFHQFGMVKAVFSWGTLGLLVTGFAIGALTLFTLLPITWGRCRTVLANFVWPFFYLIIAGGLYISRPERLSDLYQDKEDELKPLKVYPYHVAHPRNLTYPIPGSLPRRSLNLKSPFVWSNYSASYLLLCRRKCCHADFSLCKHQDAYFKQTTDGSLERRQPLLAGVAGA